MIARYFSPPPPTIIYPPEVHDYNEKFTELLQVIKHRHDPTVTTVAQGVLEWKRMQRASVIGTPIQEFLDRFYMSRIGIRFLIGQRECRSHDQLPLEFRPIETNLFVDIALNTLPPHPDYVGIICTRAVRTSSLTKCILSHIFLRISTISAKKLSVSRPSYFTHFISNNPSDNARYVCEEHYALFKSPNIQLVCPPDLTFPYIPGHLSHICFELLKNSLRAVVERYGVDNDDEYPPIKVVVVEGREDITIKISDEGGGIPRSAIPHIWT